ncbi:uncharacterized protein BDW47DRAFT_130087 [Aspergillus candidus]|uniref:Uncharacterized protein n=1 Tax=Aspergillus candidus TaxID=41067 RepID=A0A2I2EXZ5_ASPCN|nr:hypothetical protein BDW47DRAFT_130087 [Aspergillus candidus]PLB33257.1 hypothetical protein BDW47DRAFT_130087 [Aspergillus candidus]
MKLISVISLSLIGLAVAMPGIEKRCLKEGTACSVDSDCCDNMGCAQVDDDKLCMSISK